MKSIFYIQSSSFLFIDTLSSFPLVNTNVSQGLSRAERKISEATEVPQFYSFNVYFAVLLHNILIYKKLKKEAC